MKIGTTTLAPPLAIRGPVTGAATVQKSAEQPIAAVRSSVDVVEVTRAPAPTDDGVPQPEVVPGETPPPAELPRRASGVLRKLAAGGFKGVADVRLRLNFAEEINAAGAPLPEPSAATGKGRAHGKFLAAYQQTQPAPAPADEGVASPAADLVA